MGFGAFPKHKAHKTLFYGLLASILMDGLLRFSCQHSFKVTNGFSDPR